jgi:hypothetical protein
MEECVYLFTYLEIPVGLYGDESGGPVRNMVINYPFYFHFYFYIYLKHFHYF